MPQDIYHLVTAVAAIWFGAVTGSFLNMLIYRMPHGLPLIRGEANRSSCPKCGHRLAWYDLVPLWSYLWLRGRCRYCGEPIGVRYFIVEVICVAAALMLWALFLL